MGYRCAAGTERLVVGPDAGTGTQGQGTQCQAQAAAEATRSDKCASQVAAEQYLQRGALETI